MRIPKTSQRTRLKLVAILFALVVLVGSAGVWWRRVYSNPENVFNRMLDNALTTTSVTKNSVNSGPGQKYVQNTVLFLVPGPVILGQVDITQEAEEKSKVTRQTLSTKSDNFVRLVSVETSQKRPDGKPFDFSSVTGIWGQTPASPDNNSVAQLYGQNIAVPYANLPLPARRELLNQIKQDKVYKIDYSLVNYSKLNGRPTYEYPVLVKPDSFIKMMKTLGAATGITAFEQVKPEEYTSHPEVKFTFTVDVLSGDLIKVDYGNGQVENYLGVGRHAVPLSPGNAITMQELQSRLQKLQQ